MGRKLKGRQITAKGLKGALQQHIVKESFKQNREKSLTDEKQRQSDKQKSMKSGAGKKQKKQQQQQPKKAFVPFSPTDTLLLVGEGDFSFACSLIRSNYIEPENMIATSYDSEEQVKEKYPEGAENLEFLKDHEVKVLHGVDACNLMASMKLKPGTKKQPLQLFPNKRLNRIMFNFPHTGRGMKDVDRNIRDHQKLVLGYFKNCIELFEAVNSRFKTQSTGYLDSDSSSEQKIVLSVFEGEPYISWGIKSLARSVEHRVERSGAFDWAAFEGYHHRRTNSTRDTTKPAAERAARIYVFDRHDELEKQKAEKEKKKPEDSDDE